MADLQRLVDEIRFRLQSQDCELTDDLKQLAVDFVSICRDANVRLRRCGENLKQGLRSEAIHLADSEPRLLDVVATIDFPERLDWDEILGVYQLPRPEPLLLDVAEQLNEAYALQQPLEKLLDRHRLLALCRAPLAQRVSVLRQLARVDAASTLWDDDVRAFEKARADEIAAQVKAAGERGDRGALQKLYEELTQTEWHEPPSKTLVQDVKRRAGEATRSSARTDLEALEVELNAAFAALDLARCRALRTQWNDLARQARLPPTDSLLEQVGPVLGWLADEDAKAAAEQTFARAVSTLERKLAEGTTDVEELRRAGHAVLKCNRAIPEPLASRYHGRVTVLETAGGRRRRLIVGLAVSGTLLAAGVVGLMGYRNYQAVAAGHVADSVIQLTNDNNLSEARQLLEANAQFSSSEFWLAAQKGLVDAEAQARERASAFQAALESARTAGTLPLAEPYLKNAHRLAHLADERLAIGRLEEEMKANQRDSTAALETRFREGLRNLSEKLARLDRAPSRDEPVLAVYALLSEAKGIIAQLNPLAASVTLPLAGELKALTARLASHERTMAAAGRQTELLDRLTKLSSNHPGLPAADQNLMEFANTLKQYSESFPDDRRAKDFQAVAAEADLWRGAFAWQRLCDPWNDWDPPDLKTTKQRIGQCQAWLQEHGNSPPATVARDYLAYLQSIVLREEGESGDHDSGLRAKLMKLFTGPLIDDIYCVETNAGIRYYVTDEEDFSNKKTVRFNYLVGFAGESKSKALQSADLKFDRARPAPQGELAKSVRGKLPVVPFAEWDEYVRNLADLIRRDKRLDPFLRYFLLSRTLEYAAQSNSLLKPELESTLAKLHDDKIDLATRWMDPEDPAARAVRQRAERNLGQIGDEDLAAAWRRAVLREKVLAAQIRDNLMIIGWLTRDDASGWVCQTALAPRGERQLQIAVPDLTGRVTGWTVIGTADLQKGAVVRRAHSPDFKEGRPIFAADPMQRPERKNSGAQ